MSFIQEYGTEQDRVTWAEELAYNQMGPIGPTYPEQTCLFIQPLPNHHALLPEASYPWASCSQAWALGMSDVRFNENNSHFLPSFDLPRGPAFPTVDQSLPYLIPFQTGLPTMDLGISNQLVLDVTITEEDYAMLEEPAEPTEGFIESISETQRPHRKRNPSNQRELAQAKPIQRPMPSNSSRSTVTPRVDKSGKISKLAQRKAKLGDRLGSDNRAKGETRRINGVLYGFVDNEWKPACHHVDSREKFILMDAQQPGAPVWRHGMSLDYTSYCPIMQGWNENPGSVRDFQGRQVCLMRNPPEYWKHMPETGYLMCEGRIVLDLDDRPVKDFPGAPLTISTKARPWEMQGLRRTFGMTINDLRARMLPERMTKNGPERLQTQSTFTNSMNNWMDRVNEGERGTIMFAWHIRKKRSKPANAPTLPAQTT